MELLDRFIVNRCLNFVIAANREMASAVSLFYMSEKKNIAVLFFPDCLRCRERDG